MEWLNGDPQMCCHAPDNHIEDVLPDGTEVHAYVQCATCGTVSRDVFQYDTEDEWLFVSVPDEMYSNPDGCKPIADDEASLSAHEWSNWFFDLDGEYVVATRRCQRCCVLRGTAYRYWGTEYDDRTLPPFVVDDPVLYHPDPIADIYDTGADAVVLAAHYDRDEYTIQLLNTEYGLLRDVYGLSDGDIVTTDPINIVYAE